jgi:hypothetical protein
MLGNIGDGDLSPRKEMILRLKRSGRKYGLRVPYEFETEKVERTPNPLKKFS